MQESLEALKDYDIISPDEIQELRHLLLKNNPDLTDAQRAQLFAKCLHQKLDDALSVFDVHLQKNIKRCLIQKTVSKSNFAINALDIVETYTQVESVNASNIHLLASWVNQYEIKPLTEDMLLSLAHTLMGEETMDLVSPTLQEAVVLEPIIVPPAKPSKLVDKPSYLKQTTKSKSINSTIILPHFSINRFKPAISLCLFATCFLLLTCTFHHYIIKSRQKSFSNFTNVDITFSLPLTIGESANYLQSHLQYKAIDESALKTWLQNRNSTLAEEPYFSSIINTAKSFNINPLLIFAITGQEQNFVPTTHEYATQIANNPFNLYGSWLDYNTTIEDSTRIVAHTIIRLGKDCPDDQDQIKWINKRYAADPNWHRGVTYFLNELEATSAHPH